MSKPQIHVSQIVRGTKCGEQLRRILAGERRPPGIAAHVGTANHKAHDFDMGAVIEGKSLPDLDHTEDLVAEAVKSLCKEGVATLGESEKSMRERGIAKAVRINRVRHNDLAPTIRPVRIQYKWVAELEGYPYDLAGEIDLEEEDGFCDLKTSGRWPDKLMAENSMQLDMYALARNVCDDVAMPQKCRLDIVCDVQNKKSISTALKQQETVRTEEHLDAMLRRIENHIEMLDKGMFLATDPANWWCDPKWCGFYDDCPYAKGRMQVGYAS